MPVYYIELEALGDRKPPPKQAIYYTFKFKVCMYVNCILASYNSFHYVGSLRPLTSTDL